MPKLRKKTRYQQKTKTKTPKPDVKTPKPKAKILKAETKAPKEELKGGIQVVDLKKGSGPECEPGNNGDWWHVLWRCPVLNNDWLLKFIFWRLKSNNKKLESVWGGKWKAFRPRACQRTSHQELGCGNVGIFGVVGGKWRLPILLRLAYEEQGAQPDIFPHSTPLDKECKFVKLDYENSIRKF